MIRRVYVYMSHRGRFAAWLPLVAFVILAIGGIWGFALSAQNRADIRRQTAARAADLRRQTAFRAHESLLRDYNQCISGNMARRASDNKFQRIATLIERQVKINRATTSAQQRRNYKELLAALRKPIPKSKCPPEPNGGSS